jgi:general secretion pathway protein K
MCIYRKRDRGLRAFALITVLVLVALLSLFSLEFSQRSGINLKMSINHAEATRALYYAYGGYQAALTLLKSDANDYDGPGDLWYGSLPPIPFGEGIVSITIEDEKARFNLRTLVTTYGNEDRRRNVMLQRIFKTLDLDTSLVDALVDWEDSDELQLPGGAEASYYTYLNPPLSPRNAPFLTTGELLLVRGFDHELLFLSPAARESFTDGEYLPLADYITVYGDGRININTAPAVVLRCLSEDMNEFIAEDIIEYRQESVFDSIDDLKNVESVSDTLYDEIKDLITVSSNVFRITARGADRGLSRNITAVVFRDSRGFRVAYYHRSL